MSIRMFILACFALLLAACTLGTAEEAATPTLISATQSPLRTATSTVLAPTRTAAPTTIVATPRPANTRPPVVVLPPTVSNCTPRTDWPTYAVQPGDTLFSIAQRVGSTVSALTSANCIANPERIEAGQTLYVPNTVSNPPTPVPGDPLRFYLIAPEDNGASGTPVGCGDSSVSVQAAGQRTGVVTEDIRASLAALFAIDTEQFGQSGLSNSLWNSPLDVNSVAINGDTATVTLTGNLSLVGTCADARMQAQLLHTIFQYPGFNQAMITVGGANMKQLFDASGLVGPDAVYTRGEV